MPFGIVKSAIAESSPSSGFFIDTIVDGSIVLSLGHNLLNYFHTARAIKQDKSNIVLMGAGYGLDYLFGDMKITRAGGQLVAYFTYSSQTGEQIQVLKGDGKEFKKAIKGYGKLPERLIWESNAIRTWISPSTALFWQDRHVRYKHYWGGLASSCAKIGQDTLVLFSCINALVATSLWMQKIQRVNVTRIGVNAAYLVKQASRDLNTLIQHLRSNQKSVSTFLQKSPDIIDTDTLISYLEAVAKALKQVDESIEEFKCDAWDKAKEMAKGGLAGLAAFFGQADRLPDSFTSKQTFNRTHRIKGGCFPPRAITQRPSYRKVAAIKAGSSSNSMAITITTEKTNSVKNKLDKLHDKFNTKVAQPLVNLFTGLGRKNVRMSTGEL